MTRIAFRSLERPPRAATTVAAWMFAVLWIVAIGFASGVAADSEGADAWGVPVAALAADPPREPDPLDTLDHLDEEVDAIAFAYADVVPASPSESPLEAVQRELRVDLARLSASCRERAPLPAPGSTGAACDLPMPSVEPPQAGPAPMASALVSGDGPQRPVGLSPAAPP
ncbi:MAG: hypothetical protein WCK28_23235, partial [Burkholderiales bacterium]